MALGVTCRNIKKVAISDRFTIKSFPLYLQKIQNIVYLMYFRFWSCDIVILIPKA